MNGACWADALQFRLSKDIIISKEFFGGQGAMDHSRVTSKGQTTIPAGIRAALQIKPGDRLEYSLSGNSATIRVYPGLRALIGALASKKGQGLSIGQIREAAAKNARRRRA